MINQQTFGSAKEQFMKKRKCNEFSYFKFHNIKKKANTQEQIDWRKTKIYQSFRWQVNNNGLFINPNVYARYTGKKIVIALKKKVFLDNTDFATINHPNSLSTETVTISCNLNSQRKISIGVRGKWPLVFPFEKEDHLRHPIRTPHAPQETTLIIIINTSKKEFGIVEPLHTETTNSCFQQFLNKRKSRKGNMD